MSIGVYGCLWLTIRAYGAYGNIWGFMGAYGILCVNIRMWVSAVIYGGQRVYGDLWESMDKYKYVGFY